VDTWAVVRRRVLGGQRHRLEAEPLPPENATGNFVKIVQRIPVKIVLDHAPSGVVFRPGMNVDATIFSSNGRREVIVEATITLQIT
jgi:multidrug resistance efflux pump